MESQTNELSQVNELLHQATAAVAVKMVTIGGQVLADPTRGKEARELVEYMLEGKPPMPEGVSPELAAGMVGVCIGLGLAQNNAAIDSLGGLEKLTKICAEGGPEALEAYIKEQGA